MPIPHPSPTRTALDTLAQWLPLAPARIGLGRGPLTWARRRAHGQLVRPLHVCLLADPGNANAATMAFWLNERSRACRATVNEGSGTADVLWTYAQDPLPRAERERVVGAARAGAARGAVLVNPPERYDCYHGADFFPLLRRAGIPVPPDLGPTDVGRAMAVYKFEGVQHAPKRLAPYEGELPGWRAFSYVDARGPDGLSARYRAYWLFGTVRPAESFHSRDWNVCLATAERIDYDFQLTPAEGSHMAAIAAVTGLDFFAVDYLRRADGGGPVFVDLNVHPYLRSWPHLSGDRRHLGAWHAFDTRRRLGIPEPEGRTAWQVIDEALLARRAAARCQTTPSMSRAMAVV